MTIADFALDEQFVASIHQRIMELVASGLSEDDAVTRVVAELQSYKAIEGSAHFALSDAILQSRIITGNWDEPMSKDDLLGKYLRD